MFPPNTSLGPTGKTFNPSLLTLITSSSSAHPVPCPGRISQCVTVGMQLPSGRNPHTAYSHTTRRPSHHLFYSYGLTSLSVSPYSFKYLACKKNFTFLKNSSIYKKSHSSHLFCSLPPKYHLDFFLSSPKNEFRVTLSHIPLSSSLQLLVWHRVCSQMDGPLQ